MIENLDHIIQKYWAGESSLEEETQLKSYLTSEEVRPEHQELVPLFAFYRDQLILSSRAIDLSFQDAEFEADSDADMDSLVKNYWAGETTLEEEGILQAYLTSAAVAPEHLDMVPLFEYFETQEAVVMQKELDMSFLNENQTSGNLAPKQELPQQKEAKVRSLFPRVAAIAASIALLMMVTFSYMNQGALTNNHYAEVEDADEALELTMEALAFLGHKYDKGANPMKHIKQLEKTNVFSFN